MKKAISIMIFIAAIVTFASCGHKSTITPRPAAPEIAGFMMSEELPKVKITEEALSGFISALDYDGTECPYSELFSIDKALAEKNSRGYSAETHSYDFFGADKTVDVDKLYKVVKENNKEYANGEMKYFAEEPSDSKLKEYCQIVADTINWGIANIEDFDYGEIGCMLGNLKIVYRNTPNLGYFDYKKGALTLSETMIDIAAKKNGDPDQYKSTIIHEAMHILQCYCIDVPMTEDDSFVGVSYYFDDLEVNPLRVSWLTEAPAEINMSLMNNCEPNMYSYMINNLESVSLATILNDNVRVRQIEKICLGHDVDPLYGQLEFSDDTRAIEFLYAMELLRAYPDDFRAKYESLHGPFEGDEAYKTFLRETYRPYVEEVLSKLFYKNLAIKLSQNEISLNDVFYLISMHELDLMNHIPLGNAAERENYGDLVTQYMELQSDFFELIQPYSDINITEAFKAYTMNYGDGEIYADAGLQWLGADKRDYILSRNIALYDKYFKSLIQLLG
ncbi:MAG: hypothetical protein J1F63_05370 [Oscillospiraceae bacterium]|nr:hypothetical protein [Oscillospiraceae bacterium]